jgi:hypothetical protein
MQSSRRLVVRVVSPLVYVVAGAAVYGVLQLLGYIIRLDFRTSDRLAATPAALQLMTALVGLIVFAAATVLLLKLENQTRPSLWDHFRQSVIWYVFGLAWWSATLANAGVPTITEIVIGLFPVTAIVANGLVMGICRALRAA